MYFKRRKVSNCANSMDSAKLKLTAISEALGREIRVFKSSLCSTDESPATLTTQSVVSDAFYEFTSDDYYRVMANKIGDQFLKTRKIREREAAARRSRITRAVIRVRFSDGYVLEANFQPSEPIQTLIDLLSKVIARPDVPFYIYTTPPKQIVKDMTKDFYSAGFAPGAIVYFAYDFPKGAATKTANFLTDEILSLSELDLGSHESENIHHEQETATEEVNVEPSSSSPVSKPGNKPSVPKWFKR
ncbi:Tether containing UBX domain for GLUT4 [Zostera marina]|uniref:Tether containing UBX domain for GLUT4 n=1 Tax=Zostera marina TaxID=29655 RepID=A0A0K9PUP6_ZOSMR|nr:Tether containing UBX domain for GLUT4 [Zostera marina]